MILVFVSAYIIQMFEGVLTDNILKYLLKHSDLILGFYTSLCKTLAHKNQTVTLNTNQVQLTFS